MSHKPVPIINEPETSEIRCPAYFPARGATFCCGALELGNINEGTFPLGSTRPVLNWIRSKVSPITQVFLTVRNPHTTLEGYNLWEYIVAALKGAGAHDIHTIPWRSWNTQHDLMTIVFHVHPNKPDEEKMKLLFGDGGY